MECFANQLKKFLDAIPLDILGASLKIKTNFINKQVHKKVFNENQRNWLQNRTLQRIQILVNIGENKNNLQYFNQLKWKFEFENS